MSEEKSIIKGIINNSLIIEKSDNSSIEETKSYHYDINVDSEEIYSDPRNNFDRQIFNRARSIPDIGEIK